MTEPRVRVILQARTTSTRLPGKVLLPIGGIPLAILCAKRLANTGREVVLATSNEPSDDILVDAAERHGLNVFRGSLDDVLDRFLKCAADLSNKDIIVRTTADNPLPDGEFINILLSQFEQSSQEYLGTSSPADGLPYGLSAEIFKIGSLRRINQLTIQDHISREHVTTKLRENAGIESILRKGLVLNTDCSHLRVTIDTIDDYLVMARVFQDICCPTIISWRKLVKIMDKQHTISYKIPNSIKQDTIYGLITLGTAQIGLEYGITNHFGCPSDEEVCNILSLAKHAGITHLDTARAYGKSEERIGLFTSFANGKKFIIISKIYPMTDLPENASTREIHSSVDASVYASCRALNRSYIDVMMFHRYEDVFRWNGAAIDRLFELLDQGIIGEIGVSVYTPEEAMLCLADKRITHLQIPFNILDNRWITPIFQEKLNKRTDVKIHVRSIFLQGLLLNDIDYWPAWATESNECPQKIGELIKKLKRKNKIDLCLSYVKAQSWITSCVIGVERADQLAEILSLANEPPLTTEECFTVQKSFKDVSDRLLNPSRW